MITYKYHLWPDLKLYSESVFLRDSCVQFHRQVAAFFQTSVTTFDKIRSSSLRHTTLWTLFRSWTPSSTVSNSCMYSGPVPSRALYTNNNILYSTCLVMGNQCKSLNTGVIYSHHFAPTRQQAAVF